MKALSKGWELLKAVLWAIFFAVLLIAFISLGTWVWAADKPIGWTIQDQNDKGVLNAYVLGDHGGKLIISCEPQTNNIEMYYLNGNQRESTFFSARAYMHGFKEKNGSVFVGMTSTTTAEVYEFLLNADTAIEVQPYLDGTKEKIQAALRRGDEQAPPITASNDARETFITTPSVVGVVKGMSKLCPLKPGTEYNL